jgi:hypothetical protein
MKYMKNMKKCPPGVICVENVTLMFIFVAIGFIVIYLWMSSMQRYKSNINSNIMYDQESTINSSATATIQRDFYDGGGDIRLRPNVAYNNTPKDVLLNPYAPPMRDERYLIAEPRRGIPINQSTSIDAVDTEYRQMGLLTPTSGDTNGKMLPLMGRPLFVSRDKWQYYTMSEQRNSIKLPISRNGRSATTEYGVDKLYSGDVVYVEGYNQPFKVTNYDNDVIKYIPFI